MRTVSVKVFSFMELNKEAKENAISKVRESNHYLNYNWYCFSKDDFHERVQKVGFGIDESYFSGFHSQGDGAMFTYDYIDTTYTEIGKKINELIDEVTSENSKKYLSNIFKDNLSIYAKGKHFGHYYHNNSCDHNIDMSLSIDVYPDSPIIEWFDKYLSKRIEQLIISEYKDLCDSYYRHLEREYEYLYTDEAIISYIRESDMEFTSDGEEFMY